MLEADLTIASLILGASFLVKLVMLALLSASVASWTLIFTKRRELKTSKAEATRFEDAFRTTDDLTALFNNRQTRADSRFGKSL